MMTENLGPHVIVVFAINDLGNFKFFESTYTEDTDKYRVNRPLNNECW